MESVSLFKIAFNTHHIIHPKTDSSERYAKWNKAGVLAFALATIFTAGLAALVIFGTAFAKYNRIKKLNRESENANKIDALAQNAGLKNSANEEEKPLNATDAKNFEAKSAEILQQQFNAANSRDKVQFGLKNTGPKPMTQLDRDHLRKQFANIQDKNALYAQCLKTYDRDDLLSLLYEMNLKELPDEAKPYIAEVTPQGHDDSLEKLLDRDWSQVKFLLVQGPIFNNPATSTGFFSIFSKPERTAQPISAAFVKSIFEKCENLEHLTLDNCGLDNDDRLVEVADLLKNKGASLSSMALTHNKLSNKSEMQKGLLALKEASKVLVNLNLIDLSNNEFSSDADDFLDFAKDNRELRLLGNQIEGVTDYFQLNGVDFYSEQILKLKQHSGKIVTVREGANGNFRIIKDCFHAAIDAKKCSRVDAESLKELFSQKILVKVCSIQESKINDEALIACIDDWSPEKIRALHEINFDFNQITDVGAIHLANSLKSAEFPNLSKLSLRGNQISEDGKKALKDAVASKDKFILNL